MRPVSTRAEVAEFLVEPLAVPGLGPVTPEAGFCDGCSGCKVKVGQSDFLVQLVPVPGQSETSEGWCSGCKGCSAACRSRLG